jgi:hypothetical protein
VQFFGIVTCVSVHDYGIRYVFIIGLRNFVGIGDWHTILLLLLNSCLALMFVFFSLICPTGRGGRRQRRCKYIYQKNYDKKNN